MTNLPATISSLNREIGALTEKLAPITEDQVSKGIRSLLSAGLSLPSGMQADKAPEIYEFALAGVPATGVQRAITKIIRGEYDINRAFIPSPPELAAMARAETRSLRDDKIRLLERKKALEDAAPEPVSEEGRARIRGLLAKFRSQHAAKKAIALAPETPMTEEQADYYRKIMALKDAAGVGPEQRAYRSVIARKVENSAAHPDNRSKE